MHSGQNLKFYPFNPDLFLNEERTSTQINYLKRYLKDLGAKSVLEEPNYFDRDYLAEFANFYGQSVEGYPNVCKRVHIFADPGISRDLFKRALSGNARSISTIQNRYLGFIVIRPIQTAPLGKTVLSWYPEKTPKNPRVVNPSREYRVDLCGLELTIKGLAWQQQDRGVSACATIALWSMLQSSALDDYHFIPTTSEITEAANKTASLGNRVYPASKGLTLPQICEALKEVGLSPCVVSGDLTNGDVRGFSRERFASTCSAFIRSGYPVLLGGDLITPGHPPSGHAICAVGFRENPPSAPAKGEFTLQDGSIHHLYIHDDNIGPSARFGIFSDPQSNLAVLKPDRPSSATGKDPIADYGLFVPKAIIAAINNELRADPDELHILGTQVASAFSFILGKTPFPNGLNFSTRFIKKTEYIRAELSQLLQSRPKVLSKTRLELVESVRPMSKHIGLVRIGSGASPLVDILFDTSDSYLKAFATVHYVPNFSTLSQIAEAISNVKLGQYVQATEH